MHVRHRSPGIGFRSGSMGMGGVAAASRISPDTAGRGQVMYNSEYRSYNRGFGRGQPKPFQPPQPPPRKGDVFVEAGRLATEYLVSKGLLPQNVFSGKWQNGSLKNQVVNIQGFRPQDGDLQAESRIPALARLGDAAVNDLGAGSKRRFPDEYTPAESKNYMRGRRRMGSFKSYGPEWNREFGRSSSWSEKSGVSPDKEGNDDAFFGYQEEQHVNKDGGSVEQKSQSGENALKNDLSGNSESPFEKYQLADDLASKASSSSAGKDLPSEADQEPTEKPEHMEILSVDTGEVKDDSCDNEMEKQSATEDFPFQQHAEDNPTKKNGSDLLRFCTFAKVPTKTRSSLTTKGSKMGPVSITVVKSTNDSELSLGSPAEDLPFDGSSGDASSNQTQSLIILDPDISEEMPKEETGELGLSYALGQGKCTKSKSFTERSFMKEQESSEGPPGFGRCSTMDTHRGEKRPIQLSDSRDGIKKPREISPTTDTQADSCLYLSTSMQKQQTKPEGRFSPSAADNKKLLDVSLSPNGVAEPIEFTEEKQLFPGSFKICDLNLMETSDPNENHDVNPLMIFPSIPHCQKEAVHVDIDLSMNNSKPDKFCRRGKEVEVIDLESDSVQDDKDLTNPDQKDETLFTGLESFTNNAQVHDIPDVQDGYGMMISELLRSDLPNCSSVPPDVNSLQNEMGLNNGEGMLGDDDSIYMSLGEIPISMPEI